MMRPGMIGQPACGYVYCVWYSAMWVWFGGTRRVCVCVCVLCASIRAYVYVEYVK